MSRNIYTTNIKNIHSPISSIPHILIYCMWYMYKYPQTQLKPGSQYDAGSSVTSLTSWALQASYSSPTPWSIVNEGRHWSWLKFNLSIVSFAGVPPIRLLEILTPRMAGDNIVLLLEQWVNKSVVLGLIRAFLAIDGDTPLAVCVA